MLLQSSVRPNRIMNEGFYIFYLADVFIIVIYNISPQSVRHRDLFQPNSFSQISSDRRHARTTLPPPPHRYYIVVIVIKTKATEASSVDVVPYPRSTSFHHRRNLEGGDVAEEEEEPTIRTILAIKPAASTPSRDGTTQFVPTVLRRTGIEATRHTTDSVKVL